MKKGRWLVLEHTSHTKEELLTVIRAMEGAEIQIIDTKTYVRFPERRVHTVKPFSKLAKNSRKKRVERFSENADFGSPRQYCAVMLKKERYTK